MKRMIFLYTLSLVLITSAAHAERWVCADQTGRIQRVVIGDCKTLGICSGDNNQNIKQGCFEVDKNDYARARTGKVKVDFSIVNGSKIVDKTQDEIDAEQQERLLRIQRRNQIVRSIKSKLSGLGFTDDEIRALLWRR